MMTSSEMIEKVWKDFQQKFKEAPAYTEEEYHYQCGVLDTCEYLLEMIKSLELTNASYPSPEIKERK